MSDTFETITFDNARDFLEALRRSNSRWLPDKSWLTPWVFRGQANAKWGLTPSAWRPAVQSSRYFQSILNSITDEHVESVVRDNHQQLVGHQAIDREHVRIQIAQRRFEFLQVQAFVSLADDLGMTIPGGFLQNTISRELVPTESLFEPPHPAYALAQHHGMATRLLDWTQNPLYAAFFAAESPDEPDGMIAVWALNSIYTNLHQLSGVRQHDWREFRVPRSQIGFVHSQAGLFTYHGSADFFFVQAGNWPSMEREIEKEALKKLVLPSPEASELKRLLFAEGVSKAHLMPTLDNIRHTLQSHWEEAVSSESSLPNVDSEE